MYQWHIELARQAVALWRDVLTDEDPARFVSTDRPLDKTTHGLVAYLLMRCVDPADLENELAHIDAFFVERMADTLLEGVDFDQLDWSG